MFADRVIRTLESEARSAFASALAPVPGPKTLLVDDTLFNSRLSVARPLDLFTDAAFLREHGVRSILPLSTYAASTPTSLIGSGGPTSGSKLNQSNGNPATPSSSPQQALVIIIRGINAAAARHAAKIILAHIKSDKRKSQFLVLTTPRRSRIVEKVMRVTGLADTIPIAPLPLGFLPFDADLVTLDWPDAFRQVVLDGDNSALLATASALSSLADAMHLRFTTIRSAGAAAAAVVEEMMQTHGQTYAARRNTSSYPNSSSQAFPQVSPIQPGLFAPEDAFTPLEQQQTDHETQSTSNQPTLADVSSREPERHPISLVIIDRRADTITPLLTQWTYEGLLDEAVGLHNNVLDLPVSSIVSDDALSILRTSPGAPGTVRKRLRGDVDRIFGRLRDLNYWAAARQIGSVASSVRAYYDARPRRETSEISQVKDYVKGLRQVKSEHVSATAHTAIAAEISARTFDSLEFKRRFEVERDMVEGGAGVGRRIYITDAIARGESLSHIIRLCCVWSLTSNGISHEDLNIIKHEMLASFGLCVLPLLTNLERAGLFVQSVRESPQSNLSWIPIPRFGSVVGVGAGVGPKGDPNAAAKSKGTQQRQKQVNGNHSNLGSNSREGKPINSKERRNSSSQGDDASVSSASSSSTSASAASSSTIPPPSTTSTASTMSVRSTTGRVAADYSWQFSRAALRLVTDFDPEREVRPGTTAAVSAPYSGYTPLSVRLVEAALSEDGWSALPQVAAHNLLLPYGHATVEHLHEPFSQNNNNKNSSNQRNTSSGAREMRSRPPPVNPGFDAIVVVVGGIARAEASAIRLAARATGIRTIIATTAVTGPDEFILSLSDRTL